MTHVGRATEPEDGAARSRRWADALAEHRAGITRARQTVTPKLRRFIFARDGGRCVVPGCRNTRFLEVHHLRFQSHGGTHAADNLGLLCSTHHDWVHRGRIRIEGVPSAGLRFFHADGTPYGARPARRRVTSNGEAAMALRALGFEARSAEALIAAAERELPAGACAGDVVERAIRIAGRRRATAGSESPMVADRVRPIRGEYAWSGEAIAWSASWLRDAA